MLKLTSVLAVYILHCSFVSPALAPEDFSSNGLAMYLRAEFFAIAEGTHFMFSELSADLEKQHWVTATATINLWEKLHAMERVQGILSNASAAASSELSKLPTSEQEKGQKILFEKIEQAIQVDPALSKEYTEEKRKAEQQPPPQIGKRVYESFLKFQVDPKKLEEFLSSHPAKRCIYVNKMFLKYVSSSGFMMTSEEDYNWWILARSVYQLASQSGKRETLQVIYDEAVQKAAEKMTILVDNNCNVGKTLLTLFSSLTQLIRKQAELYNELEAIKQNLRKETADDYNRIVQIKPRNPGYGAANCIVPSSSFQDSGTPIRRYAILMY